MAAKDKAQYAKTTQQIDLESRYGVTDPDDAPAARSFEVEGNDTDAYVGVSPEYRGYANDTEKPYAAESGVEKIMEERYAETSDALVSGGNGETAATATTTGVVAGSQKDEPGTPGPAAEGGALDTGSASVSVSADSGKTPAAE